MRWNKALETSINKNSFISNEQFLNKFRTKHFQFNQIDKLSRISSK
jgi:hypothetical protein